MRSASVYRVVLLSLAFFLVVVPTIAAGSPHQGATAGASANWLSQVEAGIAASEYEIAWQSARGESARGRLVGRAEPRPESEDTIHRNGHPRGAA